MIAAAGSGIAPDRPDMMHPFSRMDGDGAVGSRPATALSGTTANAKDNKGGPGYEET